MMKLKLKILTVLFVLASQTVAFAAEDKQLSAIAEMGRLNGIALQCHYREQMQQIKRTLVLNLPKQRAFGELFEQKTNDSFMDFMSSKASCPGLLAFDKDLEQATMTLETVFKK